MADLTAGTLLGGRFEVVGILGYGGMATVYLVRDQLRQEEIALKVLHDHLARSPSMRARLRREVATASQLRSPHALVAWDLHEIDGLLALTMPLHRGLTLAEQVHQFGPMGSEALLALGEDLCDALGEAHRLGIVHRDVTPPNVLLDEQGRASLTDFGLVRSIHQNTQTATSLLGTSGYAAPELYQGERTDPRSDLYSLGAVLYFAATGRPPFHAPDPVGVLRRQLEGDWTALAEARPNLPAALSSTVDSLLSTEAEARPTDAAAVAAELAGKLGFVAGVVEQGRPDQSRPPLSLLTRSALVAAAVGVAVAAAGGLGLAMAFSLGPFLDLPWWAPPARAVNTVAGTAVAACLACVPALMAIGTTWRGLRPLRSGEPVSPARATPDRTMDIIAAGLVGTALVSLPVQAVALGLFALVRWAPPLVTLPRSFPLHGESLEQVLLYAGGGGTLAFLLAAGAVCFVAAKQYADGRGEPDLPVAFEDDSATLIVDEGVVPRVRRELAALSRVVESSRDWVPEVAAHDLAGTVRGLVVEVESLGSRLEALDQERRLLDAPAIAEQVERLEARLARARTLARAGGQEADRAGLERSLSAQVEILEQADRVEGHITRLISRLLEIGSMAARCRVQLLAPGGSDERAQELMRTLTATLGEVRGAAREVERVPEGPVKRAREPAR